MSTRRTVGRRFGGSEKYKWLVLKVREYPVNLALLEIEENRMFPCGHSVMEIPELRGISRPTEDRALEIADLKRRIAEVEMALQVVPEEYRNGVLYHTINHGSKGSGSGRGSAWSEHKYDFAHKNTWKKWKTRFLLEYASIIGELDHINLLVKNEDMLLDSQFPKERIYHF